MAAMAVFLFISAAMNAAREQVEPTSLVFEPPVTGEEKPAGRVVLDFSVGDLYVKQGEPGSNVTVEAEFDSESYALDQEWSENQDGSWEYRANFQETGFFRDQGLRVLFGGAFPQVTVYLPPDIPIELHCRSDKGSANFFLGGLWLTEVDLHHEKGPARVRFDQPTLHPIEKFRARTGQGPFDLLGLGNASPAVVTVRHRAGPLRVDLNGVWLRDSDLTVRGSMGPATLSLPENARVELNGEAISGKKKPAESDIPPPVLRLSFGNWFGPTSYR